MTAEVNVPDEAIAAGWHEFRYPRPAVDEPSAAFLRGLRAAAPLIAAEARRQWETGQLERMRAEVRDISNARHLYVQRVVDRKIAHWRGNVTEEWTTRWYQDGVDQWNEDHPALLALWQRFNALVEAAKTGESR